MAYEIEIDEKVISILKKLDMRIKQNIYKKINALSQDPSIGKPLRYTLKGLSRIRIGKYRLIYKTKEKLIQIVAIDHRKNAYA